MPDPIQPGDSVRTSLTSGVASEPRPSDVDVVKALVEIEQATKNASSQTATPPPPVPTQQPWLLGKGPVIIYAAFVLVIGLGLSVLVTFTIRHGAKEFSKIAAMFTGNTSEPVGGGFDPRAQAEAENLLARLAAGDAAAPAQVLAESDAWTGKTHRTPRTDELITAGLNLNDMQARAAAVQAQLALDGVPRNESSVAMLEASRRESEPACLGALDARRIGKSRRRPDPYGEDHRILSRRPECAGSRHCCGLPFAGRHRRNDSHAPRSLSQRSFSGRAGTRSVRHRRVQHVHARAARRRRGNLSGMGG